MDSVGTGAELIGGDPAERLGVWRDADSTTFTVWSESAEAIELCLIAEHGSVEPEQTRHEMARGDDGIWSIRLESVPVGQRYGLRAHGRWDPSSGHWFNPHKLLLDPYAPVIDGHADWSAACWAQDLDDPTQPSRLDSVGHVPLGRVRDQLPPAELRTPVIDPESLIIYETHVRGLTMLHPAIAADQRGTFAAMAHPAVVGHLVDLGVSAVELMPVHSFMSEPRLAQRGLSNYWGYNPIGLMSIHQHYAASGPLGAASEFAALVKALHDAGLAVICDVVYNHTAEGGVDGPSLSMRGLDNHHYYRLGLHDPSEYENCTGTGNALDLSSQPVQRLMLDSLRHLRRDLGVDGFRFDLATTLTRDAHHRVQLHDTIFDAIRGDPDLASTILIVEPWDLGDDGYRLGGFNPGIIEWNDRFRDDVRALWRGDPLRLAGFATRIAGSADTFGGSRPAWTSLNYVTAHDGFTLTDVVSHDTKHNSANGEDNADGNDHNLSVNHGHEGPTDDRSIRERRTAHRRNLMTSLLVSQGIPMLLGGDELGRTQGGNNNAYCQDNETSWYDWATAETAMFEWVQRLIALRRREPLLGRSGWIHRSADSANALWFTSEGHPMQDHHWTDPDRSSVALVLSDPDGGADALSSSALLIVFHAAAHHVGWVLPHVAGTGRWRMELSSWSQASTPDATETFEQGATVPLPGCSTMVLSMGAQPRT